MNNKNKKLKVVEKGIQKEIDKWKKEIDRIKNLPLDEDISIKEREKGIKTIESIVRELEKERDSIFLKGMDTDKIYKDWNFENIEQTSEKIKPKDPKQDNRGKDRYTYKEPGEVYVDFRIGKDPKSYMVRNANIVDSSDNGFAILVPKKGMVLLKLLNIGDMVRDIAFFGINAKIKKNGVVKHRTEITEGKNKGCYIIGIESTDI